MKGYYIPTDQFIPLHFLDRNEIWDTTKPYSFHYIPKADFPLNNFKRSSQITCVNNLRPYYFKDEAIIEVVYIRELEKYVKDALGAKEVRGLDFQVLRLWSIS